MPTWSSPVIWTNSMPSPERSAMPGLIPIVLLPQHPSNLNPHRPMTSLLTSRPPTACKLSATAVPTRQIVLVDDHPLVISGLSALINHQQDLRVCGIAQEYATAIERIEALDP